MSRDLKKFHRERANWRKKGEEHIRFSSASKLAKVKPGAFVLDLGCRDGGLKGYLPVSLEYRGMDIADEFKNPDIIIGDISEGLPFSDEEFDYVFAIEVCEHTSNPYNVFREVYRVLKNPGNFIVSVPNPYHIKELIWNLLRIPDRQGHIFSWTRQAMTALGEAAGFTLIETAGTYFHPPLRIGGLLSRSIIYKFEKFKPRTE